MKLDDFDCRILNQLQKDCRISTESLSETIGLSVSAVQRRLKKLREEEIITNEIAIINKKYTKNSISFLSGIDIDKDNYQTLSQFKQWMKDKDNIQQVYYVTGDIDLMAVITAENMPEYDAFIETMMKDFPTIRRVVTNVVLDTPKKSFYSQVETSV